MQPEVGSAMHAAGLVPGRRPMGSSSPLLGAGRYAAHFAAAFRPPNAHLSARCAAHRASSPSGLEAARGRDLLLAGSDRGQVEGAKIKTPTDTDLSAGADPAGAQISP